MPRKKTSSTRVPGAAQNFARRDQLMRRAPRATKKPPGGCWDNAPKQLSPKALRP
jgi:hypothetical protein